MATNSPPASSKNSMKAQAERLRAKHYMEHLERVRNAKAESDHHAVRLNCNNFLRLYQLPGEFRTIMHNGAQNKHLLINLDEIIMKPIDPCAPVSKDVQLRRRKQRVVKERFEQIMEGNRILVERLLAIKYPKEANQSTSAMQLDKYAQVPATIIKRFERIVELPKNGVLQSKVFRPKIFVELEAKGERAFGRITFQLYTESCPVMVLKFLRFLAAGRCEKFRFPRLYTSLWAESEITVGTDDLDCDKYYDMRALEFDGKQPGMLYFALQDFQILKQGILLFSINFRPITVKDGKRFAFGKLLGGRSRFLCLHEYATKSGKPLKEICVTSMGIL